MYCILDHSNFVVNLALGKVPGKICIPWDGQASIGWYWDGSVFQPPAVPPPPSLTTDELNELVHQSFNSSLIRRADILQKKGNYAAATALYLKAAGVLS